MTKFEQFKVIWQNKMPVEQAFAECRKLFLGENRTLSQNSLYWLWLTCIESETGNDKDILHVFLREKFLGYKSIQTIIKGEKKGHICVNFNNRIKY